ncbi:unnamed protein product [Cladocopium goreaui]|uniref:Uncharacterized protein n=1 Tax=Cladocopium goreaui TaxID=2562237 RepID=A0A9P1BKE2_9DINO|nr:unnamed protein product [Cladocopium goreaui]
MTQRGVLTDGSPRKGGKGPGKGPAAAAPAAEPAADFREAAPTAEAGAEAAAPAAGKGPNHCQLTDQEWQELFFARFRAEPAPDMHFPEDDNALNLMARSSAQLTAAPQATSSSSTDRSRSRSAASADPINAEEEDTWRLAMIYTVEGDAVQVDVPWTDVQLRVERVAQAFSLARDQVTELHYVAATPQDLLQEELECFLLQRLQGAPSSSLLSLVLADIEYRPDHRGAALRIVRRGFWLPHHCNAISVIRLLGYEGHCAPRYRRCSLWHNNRVIDIEANHLLHLASGDYIRFHLPWSPDDDFDYLFGSDCPLESTEQTSLFQKYAGVIATDGGQFHSTVSIGVTSPDLQRCRLIPAHGFTDFDKSGQTELMLCVWLRWFWCNLGLQIKDMEGTLSFYKMSHQIRLAACLVNMDQEPHMNHKCDLQPFLNNR